MVASEKTGRGLWPSWSQSSRLPCGQRRGGGLVGWLVGAKPANIFPPNYTGQVAMMVSWSIKGNFQSRRENCSTCPLLRGWSTLSQSWWELFYGNNFGSCAPEKPDLVKLVANQWLVRALYCAVLVDFLCISGVLVVYFLHISCVLLVYTLCIGAQAVVVLELVAPLDTMIGLQSAPGRL